MALHPGRIKNGMIWYCVRKNGIRQRDGWIDSVSLQEIRKLTEAPDDTDIEVCLANDLRHVEPRNFSAVFFNRVRGVIGMEIALQDEVVSLPPTRMIAANLSFDRAYEGFLEKIGIREKEFSAQGKLHAFSAMQYLLFSGHDDEPVELYRGSPAVEPEESAFRSRAEALADGIAQWMIANLSSEGGLPYKYWPSRGAVSPADNAIRRFLASAALLRYGNCTGRTEIRDAGHRNLRFNLSRYFRNIGNGRGAIVEGNVAKLGAAAVAGLAILECPAPGEFDDVLALLAAGVGSLEHDGRGFRTFFFPQARDGQNWNFYSGEALLFWAELARRRSAYAPSVERCATAFARCRARHYRNRNPAFVPWHTQACASLFAQTGRREFSDFVFEMNDWLLPMQQWESVAPDLRGRFYDPKKPEFGPPHAASTGAYLEGMADAASLARALGDRARESTYERVLQRGLRSLRQLQFRDKRDAFYVAKKKCVLGALRTEAYDNAIRVDSAAHALAAAVKILWPMELGRLKSMQNTTLGS